MADLNFKIDLRPNGKEEFFETIQQFQEWLNAEKEFWNFPINR